MTKIFMLTECTKKFTFTLWGKSIYIGDLKKILLGQDGFRQLERKRNVRNWRHDPDGGHGPTASTVNRDPLSQAIHEEESKIQTNLILPTNHPLPHSQLLK